LAAMRYQLLLLLLPGLVVQLPVVLSSICSW
jgi:hypothetical protein